jgi:hypothetical protein
MTSDVARIATSTCDKLLAKKDTFGEPSESVRAEIANFAKTCQKLDVSDGAQKKAFDAMIKAMASTYETTHAIDAFVRALEKVRNDARRGAFDNSGDEFPKAFRDALDAAVESYGEPDIDDEPPLKKLREAAGFEKAADEDEDVVLDDTHDQGEAALTCPLSTGLLVQPVKARPCGHVYSTASAKAYFKGKDGKKCAVFGCDKMLKWSDFVKDKASEIALREARKRRERTQRSQAEEIDDEDDE